MTRCTRCVLPETFPGIRFNARGVCNYCQASDRPENIEHQKTRYREKFQKVWQQNRREGTYDCLVSYSGGKDSSYTLALMVREYGARALAVTVDNGFISPRALGNIRSVTESLGVDHILFRPRFDVLRKIFVASTSKKSLFAPKTLERASTICAACMSIVKFAVLRTAVEKKIPFVVFGWSPGQAGLKSSVFKAAPSMMRSMQQAVKEPLETVAGVDIEQYFLNEEVFARAENLPYYINPLAFHDYDEQEIVSAISELGWVPPNDTDSNSTNCLLNCYANAVHKRQFGFNPYAFELAGLVRQGLLHRDKAIARLSEPEDDEMLRGAERRLGIAEPLLESQRAHRPNQSDVAGHPIPLLNAADTCPTGQLVLPLVRELSTEHMEERL